MELRFAHLADFASMMGKLVIVGIFDLVYDRGARPIKLPQMYLVAAIDASIASGDKHRVEIRFTTADSQPAGDTVELQETVFQARGPGQLRRANIIMVVNGLHVPDVGDYEFQIWVDGAKLGDVPFSVVSTPAA